MPTTDQNTESPRIQRLGEDEEAIVNVDDLNLEALAEELVKLLKQELRVENERRGWHHVW